MHQPGADGWGQHVGACVSEAEQANFLYDNFPFFRKFFMKTFEVKEH
jgi:hypothetical protein